MNRIFLWLSNLVFIVQLACGQKYERYEDLLNEMYQQTVPLVKPSELNEELKKNESAPLIILDAREKKEYEVSHLKNALFAGYSDFTLKKFKDLPKDTKIIVYCSVGYRSERIGEKLQKAGFKNVRNLYGGVFQWKNEGFPVYSQGTPTEQVHAYSEKWGKWLTNGTKIYE